MNRPEILIINDDSRYMESLSLAIEDHFFVHTSSSSLEAVNLIKGNKYLSLILLDLYIQDTTGVNLLEAIKSANDKVPILVITSKNCNMCIRKCVDLGIQTYTDKLMDVEELIDIMTKLITAKAQQN